MAIDFKHFNKEQLQDIKLAAAAIDARPELAEVVSFRDGFIPRGLYNAALRNGMESSIDVVPATEFGALMIRNVSILITPQIKADPTKAGIFSVAGKVTAKVMSGVNAPELYKEWYTHCENVPADLSETALGLLFVGETLERALEQFTFMQEQDANATRH